MGLQVSAAEAAALVNRHERIIRGRIKRGDLPSARKDPGGHVWRVDVDDLAAIPGWTLDRERLAALELKQRRSPTGILARLEQLQTALRVERERRYALQRRVAALEALLARAVGYEPPVTLEQEAQEENDAITRSDGQEAWAAYDARLRRSEGASDLLGASGDVLSGYGSAGSAVALAEYGLAPGLSPDARHILSDPTPRPRRGAPTMRLGAALPDGLVIASAFAVEHGIAETTAKKAMQSGRLQAIQGHWKHGRAYVSWALDADGRRAFYALYGDRSDFTRCAECPH